MKLIIHTDGGARGNPGPAAIGVVVENEEEKEVGGFGKKIGETTNNVAEYTAVIEALTYIKSLGESQGNTDLLDFYLDSQLVVNQLNGLFKIKLPHLRELLTKVRMLESEVGIPSRYQSVPREQNKRADFFVNQALDQ